ncbi:L,D-transpeptidase, partial [Mordavella massiliensis]|nr:L,D-transpeptidase [Mordavella massiliensis]
MVYGEQKIDGKWYYFRSGSGAMVIGWFNLPGKRVYYGSDGAMVYGTQVIGGITYYFDTGSGALLNDMAVKAQGYSSATNWLLMVDTRQNRVGVYQGRSGNWNEIYYWPCTSGAASTPTVKGQFTVRGKGLAFGSGYTCWYYTQFYG